LPSFFIWEGNTMYLTRAAAMKVLTDLCQGVCAFSIAFDYMDEAVVACTTGDRQTTGFVQRFAAMGAPWHFGIDHLNAIAHEAGMTVVDCRTVADLYRTYWPSEPLDSTIYEHYSLCTLTPR
jgi:O-methyltransferase involved in polyketide biosynthesis